MKSFSALQYGFLRLDPHGSLPYQVLTRRPLSYPPAVRRLDPSGLSSGTSLSHYCSSKQQAPALFLLAPAAESPLVGTAL